MNPFFKLALKSLPSAEVNSMSCGQTTGDCGCGCSGPSLLSGLQGLMGDLSAVPAGTAFRYTAEVTWFESSFWQEIIMRGGQYGSGGGYGNNPILDTVPPASQIRSYFEPYFQQVIVREARWTAAGKFHLVIDAITNYEFYSDYDLRDQCDHIIYEMEFTPDSSRIAFISVPSGGSVVATALPGGRVAEGGMDPNQLALLQKQCEAEGKYFDESAGKCECYLLDSLMVNLGVKDTCGESALGLKSGIAGTVLVIGAIVVGIAIVKR